MQSKYRSQPHKFRVSPNQELAHIDLLMPFSFKELVNLGKLRDFHQEADLEGMDGWPAYLIDFATYLKGGQSGPPSGSGSGPPVKVGARALKIKKLKSDNLITPMSQGSKRKYDCLSSGSRQFDSTTKRMATWKPTAENRPVPVHVRLVDKQFFNWMSDVGEASAGMITMVSPDYSLHVHRYMELLV